MDYARNKAAQRRFQKKKLSLIVTITDYEYKNSTSYIVRNGSCREFGFTLAFHVI